MSNYEYGMICGAGLTILVLSILIVVFIAGAKYACDKERYES